MKAVYFLAVILTLNSPFASGMGAAPKESEAQIFQISTRKSLWAAGKRVHLSTPLCFKGKLDAAEAELKNLISRGKIFSNRHSVLYGSASNAGDTRATWLYLYASHPGGEEGCCDRDYDIFRCRF